MTSFPAAARLIALVGSASLLSGCWLFGQYEEMKQADLTFRNEGVRVNLRTVALALQMYARDHRGQYPARAGWIAELKRAYYLPNNRMPPNPWSIMDEHTQENAVPLGPLPKMETDAEFDPAPTGLALGKGARPSSPFYEATTYGAILYDVAPARRMCVVYGVGQRGDDAVIVGNEIRGRAFTPPPSPTPTPVATPTPTPEPMVTQPPASMPKPAATPRPAATRRP